MTLNDFFHSCAGKSSHLFREFVWILTEKFDLSEAKLISGEHQLVDVHLGALKDWLVKRKSDYPLQYFIGNTVFMGHKFSISDGVLIPRMETEEISTWVVEACKSKTIKTVLDIGSGSGCLGIGTALNLKGVEKLTLIEPFGDESLTKNVESLCKESSFNTEVLKQPFENYVFDHSFDLILSNPPYIMFGDPDVADGVYKHEPHEALFGGEKGWEKVVSWVHKCHLNLTDGGLLVFEISHDQKEVLGNKLSDYKPVIHSDSFGKDRFIVIEK